VAAHERFSALMEKQRFQVVYPVLPMDLLGIYVLLPEIAAPRNKLYVDPLLPEWLPDITIRDLRVGRHKFDIRFWREGERTEFEVLDGNAKLVERCEVGAKAAQLKDRFEPI
jgi:hypothetical protein